MNDNNASDIGDFGFDMSSVWKFFEDHVEGFEPHMLHDFFDVLPDDPLMNMGWGNRPNHREEVTQLKKLRTRLQTLGRKFEGKLGIHEDVLTKLHMAACDVTDYSLSKYQILFCHENRGKPNWDARTVALMCFVILQKCGRSPTLGTLAESDRPSGEYGNLVEGALRAAGVDAHWEKPASWAYKKHKAPKI